MAHDDVSVVGVEVELGQRGRQCGRESVDVVDNGDVSGSAVDGSEGLLGVLLGDVDAQVRMTCRQPRDGRRQ